MTALPTLDTGCNRGTQKMLRRTGCSTQICVNTVYGRIRCSMDYVAHEESHCMVRSIFSSLKPVHALYYVLPAKVRVSPRYSLTFEYGVGIVFLSSEKHFEYHDRNVGSPVRQKDQWI